MNSLADRPALLPDPRVLDAPSLAALAQLIAEGESRNTKASYRAALRYWAAWYALRFGQPLALPVPCAAVVQFVLDHALRTVGSQLVHELPPTVDETLVACRFKGRSGPLALSTIVHRLAVLSKAHQEHDLPNPCRDPQVLELMRMTKRAYAKRGVRSHRKDALVRADIEAMLATCPETLAGKRDRALLLFGWSSGGRRRSEIANADMAWLHEAGDGSFVYDLAWSKTNQSAEDRPENHKPIVAQAAHALREWLAASKIEAGPIFRRINNDDSLGARLSCNAVRDIVLKRSRLADIAKDVSAHSLRSGFVTEAGSRGAPLASIMALSGHTSIRSLQRYLRASSDGQRSLAGLLQSDAGMT